MIGPTREKLEVCSLETTSIHNFLGALGVSGKEEILFLRAAYINFERVTPDGKIQKGDTIRFHLRPRRFPVSEIVWEKRILKETRDCVVIDKPAGIPVHPTCDNAVENVIYQVQKTLGAPLWVVHRLDFETAGVMVFAKSKEFANYLRGQFESRQMEKRYICYVEKPILPQSYRHFIHAKGLAPYTCSETEVPGSKYCELEILECEKESEAYRLTISLKTGRHHQIRSQLSFLGNPIIGDTVYGSKRESASSPLLVQIHLAEKGGEAFGSIDHTLYGRPSSHLPSDPIQSASEYCSP